MSSCFFPFSVSSCGSVSDHSGTTTYVERMTMTLILITLSHVTVWLILNKFLVISNQYYLVYCMSSGCVRVQCVHNKLKMDEIEKQLVCTEK